jgi:C4-dicarboxylate-specific signal transduction histidine kinase
MQPESTTHDTPPTSPLVRPAPHDGWVAALQPGSQADSDDRIVHVARLAALGEIATGIAHEINQPLAAIQMMVTSMLAEIDRGTLPIERAQRWLGSMNEQIERIAWIIGHLRSFSRNEEPSPLGAAALGAIIDDTLGLLRTQLRSHDVALDVDLAEPLPPVRGDPRRLEQVLLNLLSNARDALDELPSDAPRQIRIGAARAAEREAVVLEVSDNGPGIPPDVRERLFEPFFTTKRAGKGTGLGLSIVRTIVSECGGRIQVDSEPGAGTTFRIELPTAQPAEKPDEQEQTP